MEEVTYYLSTYGNSAKVGKSYSSLKEAQDHLLNTYKKHPKGELFTINAFIDGLWAHEWLLGAKTLHRIKYLVGKNPEYVFSKLPEYVVIEKDGSYYTMPIQARICRYYPIKAWGTYKQCQRQRSKLLIKEILKENEINHAPIS